MTDATTAPRTRVTCEFCGFETLPGPMVNHRRTCSANPDAPGLHVTQPKATCKFCGKESTAGAIKTHELYGCTNRPAVTAGAEQPGVGSCPHCGFTTTAGALAGHVKACPLNPDVIAGHSVEPQADAIPKTVYPIDEIADV